MAMDFTKFSGIVDNISKTIKDILTIKGDASTELAGDSATVNTLLYSLDQLKIQADAIGDPLNYELALNGAIKQTIAESASIEKQLAKTIAKALADQVLVVEGKTLTEYITAEADATTRVPAYFQDLMTGYDIDPALVFPKEDILMATCNTATTPVYAAAPIDLTKYGGAKLKVVVSTKITTDDESNLVATIVGLDANGEPWSGEVTITKDSESGTEFDVTPDTANTYCAEVTAVTYNGKENTGIFYLKSTEDRAIAVS
jgi:hypothetical protein